MMSFALARSDDGYPEPLDPEVQEIVHALEQGEVDLANLEGVRARIRNQPADANYYAQERAELAAAWLLGWEETDASIHVDNLIILLTDLFEDMRSTPEGQPLPSRYLIELIRIEHMALLKYHT